MRKFRLTLLVAIFIPLQAFAQTPTPTAKALATEVVELSMADSMVKGMSDSIKMMNVKLREQFTAQGNLNDRQKAILDDETQNSINTLLSPESVAAMRAIYADAYVANYTESELRGLRDFYRSPAGKAFVTKAPQVLAQAVPSLQALMAERVKDLQARSATLQQRINDAK